MLGQAEVGFVLRVSIGFILLVSVFYISYVYMENAEKSKTQEFLDTISDYAEQEISRTISDLPDNSTITKKTFLPGIGGPFSGNYFITLEKAGGHLEVIAKSYRWRDVGAIRTILINASNLDVGGLSSPPLLCINATRSDGKYSVYLKC